MSTKEKWTPADQAALDALAERRNRIMSGHDAFLQDVAASVRRSYDRSPGGGVLVMARALKEHADALLDALEPYDSGGRAPLPEPVPINIDPPLPEPVPPMPDYSPAPASVPCRPPPKKP